MKLSFPGLLHRSAAFLMAVGLYYGGGDILALSLVGVMSDNGLPARSVQWTDAAGQPRSAVMVDQRPQGAPQGAGAGYLRQLTYRFNGADRVCRGTGADGHQGDGYVQNHTATGGDNSSHTTPGTTTVLLAGAHHTIISFDMPTYPIDGNTVPTTVQWFFADGRSHPIYALSQDARATAGNLGADTRSPYGDVAYDGGAGATVGGASFGDTYKFATLAANPEQVTRASGWRYNEPNTIPYAMQWTDPAQVDAEMGHVATLPINAQDQGSDPRTFPVIDVRNTQQLNGPMIDDENWSYQILNYVLPAAGTTGSKRLTWGSNWGRPGGFDNFGDAGLDKHQYSQHGTDPLGKAYQGTRADGMLLAYSVFVVLGTHNGSYQNGAVGQTVAQMENAAQASLTAVTGTVKTTGPAGVGNAASATINYTPAGYNPVYSTWEVVASGNAVDATLTPAAGAPLDHPIFVVNGYALGQLPSSISVGAGLATPEVDYYATLDSANQRLWITVNRQVSTPVNLKIVPAGGGAAQPPAITAIPASGAINSSIVIAGMNFSGATKVAFNGAEATFTVDSATQITAVVPAAATAGPITVQTPAGTATSATSFSPLPAAAQSSLPIYTDQLANQFQDWSWATVDLANAVPVHSGAASIKVTAKAWEAFRVHAATPILTASFTGLAFWINGGPAGGQPLTIQATVNGNPQPAFDLGAAPANTWKQYTISMAALGLAGQANFDGFWIQNNSANDVAPFFVDDIELQAVAAPPPVINTIPLTGVIGASVTIAGGNFTGATAVTFNGVKATFTVDSAVQITAVVPAAATAGPIAVTTPAGTATSAVNFSPMPAPGGGGVIAGTFQQMRTDDGGWFTGFAVHSSGRLYGRTDVGGLYRSDDHGDSWTYLSGDMTSYTAHCVQGVAIAANDPNVVYQCVGFASGNSDQGIWKSTDGGVTWQHVKAGIRFSGNDPERWGGECIAIRPGNDSEIWAGSRADGLWRSSDAGTTWNQVGAATFAAAQFTSVSLPPAGRSDIWVGASGLAGPGGVWVSADEGASWTQITGVKGGVSAPAGCWRIARETNGKVLVAGGNGVLGTVLYEFAAGDWGHPITYTWSDISWPGMNRGQDAPLVAALADGRIVAGNIFGGYAGGPDGIRTQVRSLAGLWSPTDALNGMMPGWQRTPPPTLIEGGRNALMQDPTNPNRWFIAGGYGPFRTTDGGASWQYMVNGINEIVDYKVSFHATDPNRVYLPMADHGGAVVLDGGASGAVSRYITTRTLPYPDDLGLCHAMLASGDRLLALGADERNNWRPRIFRSPDNGLTWSVLATAGLPNQDNRSIITAVASRDQADDILVAVGGTDDGANGGVYRSLNGGATFVRAAGLPVGADYGDQFSPNAVLAVDAADNNARYLFLKNHGLYKSADRGASWNFLNTGLPNYGVMAADASLGGHLWVGTCCNQPVGLSHSTDGGATWSSIAGFTSVTDVDAANDRVAVLGQRTGDTFDHVYYSGDGGGTWGEITRPGYRFGNAIAVAVDPWRPGTVWISTNGRSAARFTPGVAANVSVVVQSNPTGESFIVDGTAYTTAQTFSWVTGSSHALATTSVQSGGTGIQYVYNSWSDGAALAHTVTPAANTTYTANFNTQYLLSISVNPPGSANVTTDLASPWYASGQTVKLTATPQNGFAVSSWTGVDTSNGNTAQVMMSGPKNVTVMLTAVVVPPVISAIPANGTIGAPIVIAGSNFTGATAVAFNGTSASFTIDSAVQITAVVPVGATAGPITVTTPGGTATSATSFTPQVAPPAPRLSLKVGPGQTGLRIVSGPGQYDRENIATDTTANDYGWIGGGATPATYALTISEFPAQGYQGFQAHVFLVPNSSGKVDPDYEEPNVVMLDIQTHADGTASAWFHYKTNEAGGNTFLYSTGTLGRLDCPTGPLGTWSMTFLNDTNITLEAPSGVTLALAFPDPAATRSAFSGRVTAYFGNQANDASQVGQATTFSRIQISGTPRAPSIDETFPGPGLNQHPAAVSWQWLEPASSPAGISIAASGNGLVLSWTLPDDGYSMQFSPSLSPAAWADLALPNVITQGNSKNVNISPGALPNATTGFLRLIKR